MDLPPPPPSDAIYAVARAQQAAGEILPSALTMSRLKFFGGIIASAVMAIFTVAGVWFSLQGRITKLDEDHVSLKVDVAKSTARWESWDRDAPQRALHDADIIASVKTAKSEILAVIDANKTERKNEVTELKRRLDEWDKLLPGVVDVLSLRKYGMSFRQAYIIEHGGTVPPSNRDADPETDAAVPPRRR